jgi:protein-S-isoprenylcysteine O-methyltransferase Ste14
MSNPTPIALATLVVVILCWLFFVGTFLLRKRAPKAPEAKRDRIATLGIVLQMCGFFLAFFQSPWQPFLPPVAALSGTLGIVFAVFTVGIAAGSGWLIETAIRTLGKQWALRARLVEGHKLITVGPYAHVRNPIYTGMFGMLIATGLAMEHWVALMVAVVLFAVGTVIRVRSEERLLRGAFGKEFDDYAARVPAVLPGIF